MFFKSFSKKMHRQMYHKIYYADILDQKFFCDYNHVLNKQISLFEQLVYDAAKQVR